MKRLLLSSALIALAVPAYAGNITVTGYGTPDTQGDSDITTTATGVPDTPYNYYTGPITFSLQGGGSLTVYCTDLDHYLANATYAYVPLTINGEGQAISLADSFRIGKIAEMGFADLSASAHVSGQAQTADLDLAAAAQAAIWDIAYKADGATSTVTNGDQQLGDDIAAFLGDTFTGPEVRALALDPVGENWPLNLGASQQMVVGLSAVPEPSTWAMMALGFGLLGFAGYRKTRTEKAWA